MCYDLPKNNLGVLILHKIYQPSHTVCLRDEGMGRDGSGQSKRARVNIREARAPGVWRDYFFKTASLSGCAMGSGELCRTSRARYGWRKVRRRSKGSSCPHISAHHEPIPPAIPREID